MALLGTAVAIGILLIAPAPLAMAAGSEPATGSGCLWHTVARGDTLGNLAWSAHTTVMAIARVNHIVDPNLIYVGQRLCIPRNSASAAASPQCVWHTVVTGDTLWALGRRYQRTVRALERANRIRNPNLIYAGQQLCVPAGDPSSDPGGGSASSGRAGQASLATTIPDPAPSGGSANGVRAFIQLVLPYAREAHTATGWPTSLILAQWGIEQGWHAPSYTGYNFGNCGAVPGELLVPGLKVAGSPAAFAYAPTPEDGLRIYVEVAHLSFYTAVAPAAAHGGVNAAARALGESPWNAAHYTTPGGEPGSSLIAVLHAYNLYWYDTH